MNRQAAFKALNNARLERDRAKCNYLVKRLNKDGSVSRAAFTAVDWQLNAFASEARANERAAALVALNPGLRFVVVPA